MYVCVNVYVLFSCVLELEYYCEAITGTKKIFNTKMRCHDIIVNIEIISIPFWHIKQNLLLTEEGRHVHGAIF